MAPIDWGATSRRTAVGGNASANHATPGSFAWMSMFEWQTEDGVVFGQDQEVWSLDMLGDRLAALDAGIERPGHAKD